MNTNIRRGLVAVATALACVAVLASPASAATLTASITGGTVVLCNSTGTSCDTLVLTGWTGTLGTNCSRNAEGVVNNTTTSTTSWQVTSYSTRTRFQLNGTGTWYVLTVTLTSSTAGTVTGVTATSATLNAATVSLNAVIQNTTAQSATDTACTVTTQVCRYANVNLSLSGSYAGNIHTPTASDTASFIGSGALGNTFPGCSAPFSTYVNGTATINGTAPLGVHITAVT